MLHDDSFSMYLKSNFNMRYFWSLWGDYSENWSKICPQTSETSKNSDTFYFLIILTQILIHFRIPFFYEKLVPQKRLVTWDLGRRWNWYYGMRSVTERCLNCRSIWCHEGAQSQRHSRIHSWARVPEYSLRHLLSNESLENVFLTHCVQIIFTAVGDDAYAPSSEDAGNCYILPLSEEDCRPGSSQVLMPDESYKRKAKICQVSNIWTSALFVPHALRSYTRTQRPSTILKRYMYHV